MSPELYLACGLVVGAGASYAVLKLLSLRAKDAEPERTNGPLEILYRVGDEFEEGFIISVRLDDRWIPMKPDEATWLGESVLRSVEQCRTRVRFKQATEDRWTLTSRCIRSGTSSS